MIRFIALACLFATDPTFVRRFLPDVPTSSSALTSPACKYKALFGDGDRYAALPKSITRFGEVSVDAGGSSAVAKFPKEEQICVVLDGSGTLLYQGRKYPIAKNDFVYLAPGVEQGVTAGTSGLRAIWMGFRVPASSGSPAAGKPPIANIGDVKKQVVGNHPPSTLYQLMIGDVHSTRDKISAGLAVTSLFVMEFAPGGTNQPHHHEREEEVYLVLDGTTGEMVAGGGMDGIEGRFPVKPGDAFYFRANTTVGFYNENRPGAAAHILAVRVPVPDRKP